MDGISSEVDEYVAAHKGPDEYVDASYYDERGEYVEHFEWAEDTAYAQEEEYQNLNGRLNTAQKVESEAELKCDDLQRQIRVLKDQQDGINKGRPTVLKETLFCLTITSVLGFFINFLLIPVYFEKLYAKYCGDINKIDGVII